MKKKNLFEKQMERDAAYEEEQKKLPVERSKKQEKEDKKKEKEDKKKGKK